MVKENIYTLVALIVILALGCAVALETGNPENWYGFISALSTAALAIFGFLGLGEWKRKLRAETQSQAVMSATHLCLEAKELALKVLETLSDRSFKADPSELEILQNLADNYTSCCRDLVAHAATISSTFSDLTESNLELARHTAYYLKHINKVTDVVNTQTAVRKSQLYYNLPAATAHSVLKAKQFLSESTNKLDQLYEDLKSLGHTSQFNREHL